MSKTKKGICANCHKAFEVSKKQKEKIKNGKSVFCSENCSLEKYGKTKITISEIPCCRCGKMFAPTYSQYKRYKYNDYVSNSFCSNECRWKKEYPYKYHNDYVSVFVNEKEILLDFDVFEKYSKTLYVRNDKRSIYNCVMVFEEGKKILSRLIMSVTDKNQHIDHINGDPLDNRRSNLRVVSQQENMMNKATYKNSTSKIKGVNLNKKGLWVARIQVGNKRLFLGSSKDKEVAEKLRIEAEKKYFGKYDRKYLK
jgi:hypothetical protein